VLLSLRPGNARQDNTNQYAEILSFGQI